MKSKKLEIELISIVKSPTNKKKTNIHAPNTFNSFNAEGGFNFFDTEQKYKHLDSHPKFLNMKLLEKFVNCILIMSMNDQNFISHKSSEIQQILNKIHYVLQNFSHDQCEHLQINSRNVIFQNLFKGYGLISENQDQKDKESSLIHCLRILYFLQSEIQIEKNIIFTPKKNLNLKTMLNIAVCLYEYMNENHWSIVLESFIRYCSNENKVMSHDLEDFSLMKNSIESLFLACSDFPLEVLIDMFNAIKKLLTGDSDYIKRLMKSSKPNNSNISSFNLVNFKLPDVGNKFFPSKSII